jgi:hypothetical protein
METDLSIKNANGMEKNIYFLIDSYSIKMEIPLKAAKLEEAAKDDGKKRKRKRRMKKKILFRNLMCSMIL